VPGPRFTVFTSGQGGSGTQYTFGRTFAAIGLTENREGFSGAGGAALALGVWLLLGVTGSLARGLPSLRLPPFPDG